MTEPRKHNPKWADRTRKERSQRTRDQLKQAAQMAGFETIGELARAILAGKVEVVKVALSDANQ